MEPKNDNDELANRVTIIEQSIQIDHELAAQRRRDYNNQAIGFVAGVVYAALIFYILRR